MTAKERHPTHEEWIAERDAENAAEVQAAWCEPALAVAAVRALGGEDNTPDGDLLIVFLDTIEAVMPGAPSHVGAWVSGRCLDRARFYVEDGESLADVHACMMLRASTVYVGGHTFLFVDW